MDPITLHILGCGSALPTLRHNPSSQVLAFRNKAYMIDCGEGTQKQMRLAGIRLMNIDQIFISHLHGDHCFGLPGLISTFALLGRRQSLTIFSPPGLEELLQPWLAYFCRGVEFEVTFRPFPTNCCSLIYEDKAMRVTAFPLKHSLPCCGFLFEELPSLPHIRRDMIDFYHIPVCQIRNIKEGADWICPDGKLIPNNMLVTPADPPRAYAYCSDTTFYESAIAHYRHADLLYHEATFMECDKARARQTRHSTAAMAARAAQLAEVKRLIIGHFSSRYDDEAPLLQEAQAIFPHTELANEGKSLRF